MLMRQLGGFAGHFAARDTAAVLRICYGSKWQLLHTGATCDNAQACVFMRRFCAISMPGIGKLGWHFVGRLTTQGRRTQIEVRCPKAALSRCLRATVG